MYTVAPRKRSERAGGQRRPGCEPEREVPEDKSAARNWDEFYKRIEVRGDSDGPYTEEEVDNWLARLSEEETQALAGKLKCMQYDYSFPRAMFSVLEDVIYLVETARWHLKRDGGSDEWRRQIAAHMYQLSCALQKAIEAAGEIEQRTGFSGRALTAEWLVKRDGWCAAVSFQSARA